MTTSSGYVIPVDPADLCNRFAVTDTVLEHACEEPEPETDVLLTDENYEERIEPLLDRIPQREADLIYLYYIEKKRQADIAEIFGVTQAAISYRLDRGLQRIKFLLSIPQVSEEDMRRDLALVFKEIDVNILVGMWATTCQSEVASSLGLTQGRVRHRFFKAVERLGVHAAADKRFEPYFRIFDSIAKKKFNILREVKLPQWADRGGDECF